MRFSASIIAVVCAISTTATEAAVRFTETVWRPDLGISVPCLISASAHPLPMPRASAYLVSSSDGGRRLEDRYDTFDLWTSFTVRGRWRDVEGNELYLARLSALPPLDAPGTTCPRREFYTNLVPLDAKRVDSRNEAVQNAAPVETRQPVRSRRAQRKNLKDLWFYPSTNDNALVCAFQPRSPEKTENPGWYLATLILAPGADIAEARARFDEDFLDRIALPSLRERSPAAACVFPAKDDDEQALLRRDVRRSVANYDEWHCTAADDALVLDDLDVGIHASLVPALTNDLPRFRCAYARCVPSPLSATNQTALVRVFKNREEYLAHVGVEQKWTAALWSPVHRELALYHADEGNARLLSTVWHEAFHQYLAYAGSMISSSPWFNEGHAQLFEHTHVDRKGQIVFDRDPEASAYVQEYAAELAGILPDILRMDYDEFYAGTQEEVQAKYRVAWSIAYFLEVGAPDLRFRPYERLRADYMKALVRTRSMLEATETVLGEETREKFIAHWLAFWKVQ